MICIKKHETPEGHLLLAACDANLIDNTFEEGDLELKCPSSFYKDEEVDAKTFATLLQHATHANLVGDEVIRIAQEDAQTSLKAIKKIKNIPYAYIIKTVAENL